MPLLPARAKSWGVLSMVTRDDLRFVRSVDQQEQDQIRPITVASWLLSTVGLGLAIVAALIMIVNGIL
jgi:hypothetical protein